MPTIEIASVNSSGLHLRQEDFEVTIIENQHLQSNRPLFNDYLKDQDATMIQIGDPDYRNYKNTMCCAGDIIDWEFEPVELLYFPSFDENYENPTGGENQQFRFKFLEEFRKDIDRLLTAALESSPIKKGFLMSDYCLGPDTQNRQVLFGISDLWSQHDQKGLLFNTMYEVYGQL